MLKKTVKFMLLLILVVSPTVAMGQHMPQGKWWHNPRVSEKLNLSEEEKRQLDEIFIESRLSSLGSRAAWRENNLSFRISLKARRWTRPQLLNSLKDWKMHGPALALSALIFYWR